MTSPDARLPVRLPSTLPTVTAGKAAIAELHRGMNLGNALEAPNEGDWGVTLSSAHFQVFADAGFDHVRLPVRFSAHAGATAPYSIDATFFARVDWALDQAQARGLAVILDVHHFVEFLANPSGNKARFIALWQQIATRYRARPASLKFELMNEPNGPLDAQWNAIFPEALAAVRAIDPTRAVLLDSTSWSAGTTLSLLPTITDPNLVVSFHMYDPVLFTHQAASWMTAEYQTRGLIFPAPPCTPITPSAGAQAVAWTAQWFTSYNQAPAATNVGGMKAVEDVFAAVDAFVTRTGRAVHLGEFGVIDQADAGSRARWVRLIRESAEARGIPWTYWDDGGSLKAVTPSTGSWVPYLKTALLGP
ncbi:MAG: glycoside hydrolase family 5 protein [Polyangiaceae bacterium]